MKRVKLERWSLDDLPIDCIGEVFKFFGKPEDFFSLSLACKYFYQIQQTWTDGAYCDNVQFEFERNPKKILTYVKNVKFSSTLTDRGLEEIKNFPNVRDINLRWCYQITDDGLKHLENVQVINLFGCNLITDEGLRHLKNARVIILSSCKKITDEGLKHLKNVRVLSLSYCDEITDDGLKHLKKVKKINLHQCKQITKDGVKYLKNVQMII